MGFKLLAAVVRLKRRFFYFDGWSLGELGKILTLIDGGFLNVLFDLIEFLSKIELILLIRVLTFEKMLWLLLPINLILMRLLICFNFKLNRSLKQFFMSRKQIIVR
jgi:hypothetical protein